MWRTRPFVPGDQRAARHAQTDDVPQHLNIKDPGYPASQNVLKSQLWIGLPAGFQSVMYSISNVIIQAALNRFGTDTVAAWSAYGKLDAIFWMVSGAIGISITTFVGQNYGARKYDRVHKSVRICLGIDSIISVILIVFLMLFRVPLFRLFTQDPSVIRIGSDMLALITPCYIFFVFIEVLAGALRGMGM